MPFLERAGKPTLHYQVDDFTDPWRQRPYLILQHGFGRSGVFWYQWVPYLARFYKVVRPDLRGLGRSGTEFDLAAGIRVDDYIGDLVDLVGALGGGAVHYCGESLGGIIGMALAAERPELVRTLTLVAAPIRINEDTQRTFAFGHPSWQQALRRMGARGWSAAANGATRFPPGTEQGHLDWYADEMGKSRVQVMVAMSELAARVEATPFLDRIRAPVLGLYPSPAPVTIQQQEAVLRERIRDLRIVHVPCATHMIQNVLPASCARQLLYFASAADGTVCDEP
jgi:3-oxoadipate enol-lactonase